jgi:hypothetical protein
MVNMGRDHWAQAFGQGVDGSGANIEFQVVSETALTGNWRM